MRVIIQRVTEASVTVEQKIVGKIGKGILVLVGFTTTDTFKEIDHLTNKILKLRLWSNKKEVRWAESVVDQELEVLCVSQFTLYTVLKGNKPDFHLAMEPETANKMYETFLDTLKKKYRPDKIQSGVFGGYMSVGLVNDGPVTIDLEYPEKKENVNGNSNFSNENITKNTNGNKAKKGNGKNVEEKKDDKQSEKIIEENKLKEEIVITEEIKNICIDDQSLKKNI